MKNIFLALLFFSSNSFAEIGLVKICLATNAPSSPHSSTLVTQQNSIFYQSQSGEDDGSLSIIVHNIEQQDRLGCSIGSALVYKNINNNPLPRKGTKWYRVAVDEGWKENISKGQYTSIKVAYQIPLEAEATENFRASNGRIKICRAHGIIGSMDGKQVDIPADTYTGACDRNGERCRNIQFKGEAGILGKGESACITVNAELIESDGKPIKSGESLLAQWFVPGFNPTIKVVTDFK